MLRQLHGVGLRSQMPGLRSLLEGAEASLRIGPGSWHVLPPDNSRSLFCTRCYNRLYYPKSIERSAWCRWYDQLLQSEPESFWLLPVLARVNASLESAPWYAPLPIELGDVACPGCSGLMVESNGERDRLICPACGSAETVLSAFTSHLSLAFAKNGFR